MYHKILIIVAVLLLSVTMSGVLPHSSMCLAADEHEIGDKDDMANRARKREQCIARCLEKNAVRNPVALKRCTARCKEKSF
ncbi:MAG: hypothetical protein P8182_16080 [Deltaproteobacteria bacterium]